MKKKQIFVNFQVFFNRALYKKINLLFYLIFSKAHIKNMYTKKQK